MNKLWSVIQYGYLVIGGAFLVNGMMVWSVDKEEAFIKIGFGTFIILVFFFKRKFRRKIEERNKNN